MTSSYKRCRTFAVLASTFFVLLSDSVAENLSEILMAKSSDGSEAIAVCRHPGFVSITEVWTRPLGKKASFLGFFPGHPEGFGWAQESKKILYRSHQIGIPRLDIPSLARRFFPLNSPQNWELTISNAKSRRITEPFSPTSAPREALIANPEDPKIKLAAMPC
jgi:hypothetical protein